MRLRTIPAAITAMSLVAAGAFSSARAIDLGYAGRLAQEDGSPLAGPIDVTLRFFASPSGADQLGSSLPYSAVALNDGVFQLKLSLSEAQQTAIFGDGSSAIYVEIEAAGKVYPRQAFQGVPLALRVPVDNDTLVFSPDSSKLTVARVDIDHVTGLAAALGIKQPAVTAATSLSAGSLTTSQQAGLLVNPYGTAANQTGELRFGELSGGNFIGFKAPDDLAANKIWTLPATDGSSGQFLSTNGSGLLSWGSPAGGGNMLGSANLSDLTDTSAARGNLGLGTLAIASAVGSAQITDASITNADIAGTAQVATSKLSGALTAITGHGLGALASMSSVTSAAITDATIVDADVAGTAAIATSKLSGAVTSVAGHGLGSLATLSSVTSAEIGDGEIVNVDIAGTAAIATSKLAGPLTAVTGHGLGGLATLNSVGAAEITDASIANADIAGTAAIATSKLSGALTSIASHGLGSLATLSTVGSSQINDGSIADADVSGTAAIATSKLSGSVVSISGHGLGALATLSAVGSAEITDSSITDADISGAAAISSSKISFVNDGISGDKVDGGTISNFASTGIDDNAAALSMTIASNGNVGIGTTTPTAKFQVNGQVTSALASDTTLAMDMNLGNFHTNNVAAGTLVLNNMADATTYTVILTNASGGNYVLSGSSVSTWKCLPACASNTVTVTAGTHTALSITKTGTTAYVFWGNGL